MRRTLAVLSAATLAATILLGAAEPAGAAPRSPAWDRDLANNPVVATVSDCRVTVGVIDDTAAPAAGSRRIGGVGITCASQHDSITVVASVNYSEAAYTLTAGQSYDPSAAGTWISLGNTSRTISLDDSSGLGSRLLRTGGACMGGYQASLWLIDATVRIDGYSYTHLRSRAYWDPRGC